MSSPEIANGNVTNGKATASLILGVISIVLSIVPLGGLILGIIGLIIGVIGLREIKRFKQGNKKIALSGIVCSSLGILLPIVLSVVGYMAYMTV
ncbi:DUF4190 domain-containing protein [Lentibacillus cibarius]|uniref:DUF4190 domain-containing protein n=1 Tax=Lentibacillus cibarius TaxID=2583219 RepID=A0A549YIM0_9BACI|nr:DUF4190 domain-containing protein [Lentibacillus cibarius]TRM11729.1 DUF4190 domain-containing protein [Lentibacillus cibarius]